MILRRRDALITLAAGLVPLPAVAVEPQPMPWPKARALPPLALPALDGPAWDLAAAKGQVVVLNFWASWCEPCRSEMPSLELLAERHQAHKLAVIAVNFKETEATIRRYVAQSALTLPIVRDADGAAARAFGVRVFPSTIVVGRDGRPVFTITGEVDWTGAEARRWITPLL
ncbi:TlpA family protein disulfide reductase [Aquincola sp. S2]|uniref:TlpA family protein disulfide reductase n=1 Tax=Pseudaquabacterium terrae TaxID=2732868 RepID=A0ABX2ENS0_9BURK|nr:TlpA disulfide reductase family protein [Aquabacterium terrae]NRF70295.1 TlpA family protein disulfide reductase [Aquabacterium terrae]